MKPNINDYKIGDIVKFKYSSKWIILLVIKINMRFYEEETILLKKICSTAPDFLSSVWTPRCPGVGLWMIKESELKVFPKI